MKAAVSAPVGSCDAELVDITPDGLHHRAHVGIDLGDVGVGAELVGDVDWLEHLGDDLGRQRQDVESGRFSVLCRSSSRMWCC
ncbi:hypothetical protein H7I01_19445 [Mycobacterium palustre]|nr:hypothetical protein [Mycobacterium palustre]